MRQITKRQHTVPRCYLEHFTDENGLVWVLDTKDNIFSVKPENILVEKHFYTLTLKNGEKDLFVEDTLANIEGSYASIYRDKISKQIPLTPEERAKVAVFIAALYLRTRPFREGIRGAFTQLKNGMEEWKKQFEANPSAKEYAASMPSSGGESISLEDVNNYLEKFDEAHSVSVLENLAKVAQIIFNMKWSIQTDSKARFVTSDDPVTLVRPASVNKYGPHAFGSTPGLLYQDVELTLPLSKDQFLLAGWILEDNTYLSAEDLIVNDINYRTITRSADRVITKSKQEAEAIRDKYTETKDKKTQYKVMPFVSNGPTDIKPLEEKIEKLHEAINKKRWWEHPIIQPLFVISAVAGLITLFR